MPRKKPKKTSKLTRTPRRRQKKAVDNIKRFKKLPEVQAGKDL